MRILFIILALFFMISLAYADNHVLDITQGGYVRLKPNMFNKLEAATVEGWVCWEKSGQRARFFSFGDGKKSMMVYRDAGKNDLIFQLNDENGKSRQIRAVDALTEGRWYHVAAVSGKGGMKLYLNGVMVGSNAYDGCFSQMDDVTENFLGVDKWQGGLYLRGKMDEVRIWKIYRISLV